METHENVIQASGIDEVDVISGMSVTDSEVVVDLIQLHTVPIGRRIQPNGAHYLSSGPYAWTLHDPDGKPREMMNSNMPGPSFVPDMLGEWTATLQTNYGPATYIFTVVEDV